MPKYDVVVVGAGIVGLAVARELTRRRPGIEIAVIEHPIGGLPASVARDRVTPEVVEVVIAALARGHSS